MLDSRRAFQPLLLLWAVLCLGHLWEAQLKMDAMTYATLAKHILSTGDWKTLHYTPSAYADFYQHPPLIFWIQAVIFRWLGATNLTARLLPSLFALGTVAGVFAFGKAAAGRRGAGTSWAGFSAGLVLLATGAYIKYGSDFLLDGPLAFFLVWGALAFLRWEERSAGEIALFGLGLAQAAALLTKGMVGLALPAATVIYAVCAPPAPYRNRRLLGCLRALAYTAIFLAPWLIFAGGGDYLRHYWIESVAGRLQARSPVDRLAPWITLGETYWPWLPLWIFGMVSAGAGFFRGPLGLCRIFCLVIPGAFTLTGNFLEHYLVAFYPFAAVVASDAFRFVPERFQLPTVNGFGRLAILAAFILAIVPIRFRAPREEMIRRAVPVARAHCPEAQQLWVSEKVSERWLALATTLWETNWTADWVALPKEPAGERPILLVAPGEDPGQEWAKVALPGTAERGFELFQPEGLAVVLRNVNADPRLY